MIFSLRPPLTPFLVIVVTLLLSGCQTAGIAGLSASAAPADLSEAAASAIAGDMVSRFAEQIGPGTATIALRRDSSPFGDAVEAALKGWGYAVITDQKPGESALIPLAYAVTGFEDQLLARFSTAEIELGRAYTVSPAGAEPASALSLMQRG